jgi:hypothetical protein
MTDDRPGATLVVRASTGHEITVYPTVTGGGRLMINEPGAEAADAVWDYLELPAALAAAMEWDGVGEPAGFYRRGGDQAKPPCTHPQAPPTDDEISGSPEIVTRACGECGGVLYWRVGRWLPVR